MQAGGDTGPGIEVVPDEIEFAQRWLIKRLKSEMRTHAIEHASMHHVKARERLAASADLFHPWLIFGAPGIGKRDPV